MKLHFRFVWRTGCESSSGATTRDTAYRIGQRIVIREAAVLECLALTEKLAAGMAHDAVAPGTPSSTPAAGKLE